jgi:hypothetical protein
VQVIRNYKSVFGRNLYNTDVTNSFLEIRLALYSSVFEDMKSYLLTVADFLTRRSVTLLILILVSFCISCSADTRTKTLGCAL